MWEHVTAGPKGVHAIFQKNGKKRAKEGNIFENFREKLQNLKIFLKRAGDRTQ